MKPPALSLTFETPLGSCWFDKDLLCIDIKDVERTGKNTREHYWILKSMIRKKVCWLMDISACVSFQLDSLATIQKEMPRICKALAMIADRDCEKKVACELAVVKEYGVPVGIFESENEARKWLQTFLA